MRRPHHEGIVTSVTVNDWSQGWSLLDSTTEKYACIVMDDMFRKGSPIQSSSLLPTYFT